MAAPLSRESCLSSETIVAFARGDLSADERHEVDSHIDGCAECRVLLVEVNRSLLASWAEVPGTEPPEGSAHGPITVGQRVGRYFVLEWLGAGGMGVVYSAYDPELDRKVALKVLRDDGPGSRSSSGTRDRLLREAKAMAQISHPNVVSVFDVGTDGGRVFVAMEFIEGSTVREWLADEERPWHAILNVYLDAARGLAAAHAKDVVHRDFKPENVLIDQDGRARVSDFGLARLASSHAPDGADPRGELHAQDLEHAHELATFTRTGAVLGTPRYMAPEQRVAQGTTRSDQFSFCVALFESLYGDPPFARSGSELDYTVGLAEPKSSPVPRRIYTVLAKGLSSAPEDRHPSMNALVHALRGEARRSPRAWLVAASVLVGLLMVVAGGGYARLSGRSKPQVCRGFERVISPAWSAGQKRELRDRMLASQTPYVVESWPLLERTLDAYSREWVEARTVACEATRVRGEQSEELMDLRMQCLDDRLRELGTVTEMLSRQGSDLGNALRAARDLSRVDACADTRALSAPIKEPKDAASREQTASLRERLADLRALMHLGKYEPGLVQASAVVAGAKRIGYRPLDAEALALLAQFQSKTTAPQVAERTFYEALYAAESSHHDEIGARLWVKLTFQVGYRGARYEEGIRIGELARAAIERLGGHDELESKRLGALGIIYLAMGGSAEAQDHFERSLVLTRKVFGPDSPDVALCLQNLGMALRVQGKGAASLDVLQQSLTTFERGVGPRHPEVGGVLDELGSLYRQEGRYEEAIATHKRAISISENAQGRDYPDLASDLSSLGDDYLAQRNYVEALAVYKRALATGEKVLGAEHLQIAYILTGIGRAKLGLGAPRDAARVLEGAFELRTRKKASPLELAATSLALAQALWASRAHEVDRGRAHALATSAREAYATAGASSKRELAEATEWLATHTN